MPINGYDYDGEPPYQWNAAQDSQAASDQLGIRGGDLDADAPSRVTVDGVTQSTAGPGLFASILKSLVGGGKVNSGPGGGGSIFDLGPLAGMIGSGINAAFLEKQAGKTRDFQKSQTEAGWAREDRLLAEKRARMAPIRKAGLLSSAITTSRTGP